MISQIFKRPFLLGMIVLIPTVISAQDFSPEKYRDENAVVIQDEEHVTIEFQKGKLVANSSLDKETLLLNDLAPSIYNNDHVYHSTFNVLKDINGATLIPEKNGYKKVQAKEFKTSLVKTDYVFIDDSKKTTVTYPGLVKNAHTLLHYEIEHKDIRFLPPFYFESYIPVAKSVYSVTLPKTVTLKYLIKGTQGTERIKYRTEETKRTITHIWTAEDMPKANTYDDAPNPSYYIPHIIAYIADYTDPDDDRKKPVSGSVKDLYSYYIGFIKDVDQIPPAILKEKVKEIIKDQDTENEKAKSIYKWVQQHVRYVAIEDSLGGFIPRPAQLVYDRKFGDCKDMASLLVGMLRAAGIDAHFVWIGTRDKPYTYEELPLPVTDNHMICAARINGTWVFIDGTDATIPFGIPPHAIQGKEALIAIDKEHHEIVTVPEINAAANILKDSTRLTLNNDGLSGSVSIHFTGYSAWDMAHVFMYRNEKEIEETIKGIASRGSNKFIQKKYRYHIADKESKELTVESSFEINDYAQKVGKEWYVNMNLQRSYTGLKIDTAKRKVDIEFSYRKCLYQVVALTIPSGYHISYVPDSFSYSVPGIWNCSIKYTVDKNTVTLVKELVINTLYIHPKDFAAHNLFLEELEKQYKESIVLTADK